MFSTYETTNKKNVNSLTSSLLSPVSSGRIFLTKLNAFTTLSCLVTSNCIVFKRSEPDAFISFSPSSVRQLAITLHPRESKRLAHKLPKPVSHPVMKTYLLVKSRIYHKRIKWSTSISNSAKLTATITNVNNIIFEV